MARPPYPNGKVPASKLKEVAGVKLWYRTANAAARFIKFAKSKGYTITIAKPIGGNRSTHTQELMQHRSNWPALNIDTHMTVSVAGVGASTHGWGTAVDFLGDFAFIHKYAPRYGFSWTFGSRDRNHWQHDNRTAVGSLVAAALHTSPVKRPQKLEILMLVTYAGTESAQKQNKGKVWLIGEFTHKRLEPEDIPVYKGTLGDPIKIKNWSNITRLVKDCDARALGLAQAVAAAAVSK